jgi:hypothetical protein
MDTTRKLAIAAGVCYLITHVTSVPAGLLFGPILNRSEYVLGSVPDTTLLVGSFLEVICALGNIGTSVALFPVVRRYSEGGALGYVGLRTLESGIIAAGVLPLLTLVTLQQGLTGTAATETTALGGSLIAMHNWTRLLGPGLVCGVNTVLMAYLLYRFRLVPRFIPMLGLIGGPMVFAYHTADMFGAPEQVLSWAVIGVVPIFAWEISLAIRLITRGFNASALVFESATIERTGDDGVTVPVAANA